MDTQLLIHRSEGAWRWARQQGAGCRPSPEPRSSYVQDARLSNRMTCFILPIIPPIRVPRVEVA